VPRYYFNVCCDGYETTDVVGRACPDDLGALNDAMQTASELIRQRLQSSAFAADGWVEVEDERHRSVLRLPLRAAAY